MEESNKKLSIWRRDLNLIFVYGVIFLAGLLVVFTMVNILNDKVEEINNSIYEEQEYM